MSKEKASYVVLARKYRPQQFSEVVGQEPVVTTLQNAIATSRLAHAYLFCGMRGTGKTTLARLFAKALNCQLGPTAQPCGECPNCREIASGISLDVLEIDGASNRGIDQIRDLRENVKFAPAAGKFKIYIIDEVHMLTTEAFNALLKTLEEPPAHVKFFFATTEAHKLPATITSRCQRFDLKRIPTELIVAQLQKIAAAEKVKIEEGAIFALAIQSQGSLRDAESLLDQMMAYCDKEIRLKEVEAALGLIQSQIFFNTIEAILEKKGARLFELVDELSQNGKDFSLFLSGLLGHLRNLMLGRALENPRTLLEVPDEEAQKIIAQGKLTAESDLTLWMDLAAKGLADMRFALSKRVILEMTLLKMVQFQGGIPIVEILAKIDEIENRLSASSKTSLKTMPAAHRSSGSEALDLPPQPPLHVLKPQMQVAREPQAPNEEEETEIPGAEEWAAAPPAVPAASVVVDELQRVRSLWPQIMAALTKVNPLLKSYLHQGEVREVKEERVVIGFDEEFSFHRDALDTAANKEIVEKQLELHLGKRYGVQFLQMETSAEKADKKEKAGGAVRREKQTKLLNDPVVKKAIHLFGGKIINIKE